MKNIASSLVVLGVVILVASSCFFTESSSDYATLKIAIGEKDRTVRTCYAVNVIGPGIRSFDPRYPVPPVKVIEDPNKYCHYPGIGSPIIPYDSSAGGDAVLEVGVPIGNPRLVQVIGMDLASGYSSCPNINFSEFWRKRTSDITAVPEIDNDKIYEVGRALINLPPGTREKEIMLSELTGSQNQFGKNHCDPPSAGGLQFHGFVTSIFATRSLSSYVTSGGGIYQFTITDGMSTTTVSDVYSFGGTQTDLVVSVEDTASMKTASGTVNLFGFNGGTPDPAVWLWMTADKLATDGTAWVPHMTDLTGLINLPILNTVNANTGPRNYPVTTFLNGTTTAGNISQAFTPSTEDWDDAVFFLVFRPHDPTQVTRILCLSSSSIDRCTPASLPNSFVLIKTAGGQLGMQGCLQCNLGGGIGTAGVAASSVYYALAVRLTGTNMTYSLAPVGGGGPTNGSATLGGGGLFSLSSGTPGILQLALYTNPADTDIAELIVYRHKTGSSSSDHTIPCNYIKAKYGANLSCTL